MGWFRWSIPNRGLSSVLDPLPDSPYAGGMIIEAGIRATRGFVASAQTEGKTVGFVPTMGALHEGHLSLIRSSREVCDVTAVSIFVNPTQFGPAEDLKTYPRTFDADCRACEELGVDLIFAPTADAMYPDQNVTWVSVEKLGDHLCGASRPHFFRGVCTVVAKLFHIVPADKAFFGEKDYQQLAVITRMAADLNLPIEIVGRPTVREADGLAMSSRNRYLSIAERKVAPVLYQALQLGAKQIAAGATNTATIIREMQLFLRPGSEVRIDYISIVDREFLQPVREVSGPVLIAIAAYLGKARLIDNIKVDPPGV